MHFQTKISQITMYFQSKNTKNDAFSKYNLGSVDKCHFSGTITSFTIPSTWPTTSEILESLCLEIRQYFLVASYADGR